MCGRFSLHSSGGELAEYFGLPETPALLPRYNISPGQDVAFIRRGSGGQGRQLVFLLWGLIPAWSKAPVSGSGMINARSESAAEKPTFRGAFRRRRGLLPADGFFEWPKGGKKGDPCYFQLKNGQPQALAGLWETWSGPDGESIHSCTILTTEANELVGRIHSRMPAIMEPDHFETWLDVENQDIEKLQGLLKPYPAEKMICYRVSPRVNNPRNEGPKCIEPATGTQASLW